jgi:hypothetical protein
MCGAPVIRDGRCARHLRPGTVARGYGAEHKKRRASYELAVAQGRAYCWRCKQPIAPGEPWDLGHDDNDRGRYAGPEHARCNRSAAGRISST